MQILFVINQLYKGGAETALVNLLNNLDPMKFDVDLLIFDQYSPNKNLVSLIPYVPNWVNVITGVERNEASFFVRKGIKKIANSVFGMSVHEKEFIKYLASKKYDLAISYGEWFSPEYVVNYAQADTKCVWIHSDIDKAAFLDQGVIDSYAAIDKYVFVSESSAKAALSNYPYLEKKMEVIHNQIDLKKIQNMAKESLTRSIAKYCDGDDFTLVTVANFRPEKNHLRQVAVLKELVQMGLPIKWLNIGSKANVNLVNQIESKVKEFNLQNNFILIDALDNPFPVVCKADAVCVLSDHESWSMVISEAKALKKVVIATRTSGAIEQITDGENGLLCDQTVSDIVDKVKKLYLDSKLKKKIELNLENASRVLENSNLILEKLCSLVPNRQESIVYVFDNINYISGARSAALEQIKFLSERADVSILSVEPCHDLNLAKQFHIFDFRSNKYFRCVHQSAKHVLRCPEFGIKEKCFRLLFAFIRRTMGVNIAFNYLFSKTFKSLERYDVVCVVSEGSQYRKLVSNLDGVKKVQWIHTDYATWRDFSWFTKALTKKDDLIYSNFDVIVCLSESLRNKFCAIYPRLMDKTMAVPNLIDYTNITKRADYDFDSLEHQYQNIITIGRMEAEKRYDKLLEVASILKQNGVKFKWYFVGGGILFDEIKKKKESLNLSEEVVMTGHLTNPLPILKHCDLMVLASNYEGTPVTIDEAKVLGIPVFSTNVGGVVDQLDGKYGFIFSHDSPENMAYELTNYFGNQKAEIKTFGLDTCKAYNDHIRKSLTEIFIKQKN